MANDSPAVILYDADGNPIAIADGDAIQYFQKGIIFAGKTDDGYASFASIASTNALKIADVGSYTINGSYYAGSNLIPGSAATQNLFSIGNPIGSSVSIRVYRMDVRGNTTSNSSTAFLYKLRRTSGLPSGGTILSSVNRESSDPAASGIIRSAPTATATGGSLWSAAGGTYSNNAGLSLSNVHQGLMVNFERNEFVLAPGEGLVVTADANTINWTHVVNVAWNEVL
jgi:hypothetical protein